MNKEFRGGNSRLLAKSLDQLANPAAILDRRGMILFANASLCRLANSDATQLVGKQCSWQLAPDESPFAAILTSLAPPASALQGKLTARRLTAPIVFGSSETGQLFLPLQDEEGIPHLTIVVIGQWEALQQQLPGGVIGVEYSRRQPDRTLVAIRSKWKTLDGLLALVGDSPAIELAMSRTQLAIAADCSFLISGPPQVGKSEVVQAIFLGRLKRGGLPRIAGQLLPVDCSVLDTELVAGMLEVFTGRLRVGSPACSHLLLLQNIEELSDASIRLLLQWHEAHQHACRICGTSLLSAERLAEKSQQWQCLVASVAQLEIRIPSLASRREDIAPLALHCMARFCKQTDRAQLTFSAEAIDLLTAFPWPENLKQLVGAVEDSVRHSVLSATIQSNHLPVAVRAFPSSVLQAGSGETTPIDLDAVLLEFEKLMLQRALRMSPRNRARAARMLGISRPRLLRRIHQLGLDTSPQTNRTQDT